LFDIRYIWIAALPIIQDDRVNWKLEAQTMEQVYRGCFLTIAAQGARNSKEGCFAQRSQLIHTSYKLFEINSRAAVFVEPGSRMLDFQNEALDTSPLCNKAWMVQKLGAVS
jgi:hypothetical protein